MDDVVLCGYTIGKARDMEWSDANFIEIYDFEPTVESGLPRTSCLMFDTQTGEIRDYSRPDSPTWKLIISGIEKQ
jgi:hypothetical protein